MNSSPTKMLRIQGSFLLFLVFGFASSHMTAPAADNTTLVTEWVAAQTNIHSWTAEFVQTLSLRALTQPLTAAGRVWFAAPNRFRWELGTPPQTIALRQSEQMLVIYPKLKRAEKYPLTGNHAGPWTDTLALL